MARANAAYYAARDPFADFTTSPEIGQVFGEILGAWAACAWRLMAAPARALLVEAGPGRGTLMQDALRTIGRVAPDCAAALSVHLIETSARLRAVQALRVPHARWHADLESLPAGPMVLLANEFLDALPVRQFVRAQNGWAERFVADGRFVDLPVAAPMAAATVGAVVEVSEAGRAWVSRLAGRLVAEGGAALLVDYGPAASGFGDTLQALRGGRPADPLAAAGEADLTAHVDFAAMAAAARAAGAAVWGPVTQGDFLGRLGLYARTEQLAAANPARAATLRAAAFRLGAPAAMGTLFKVLCVADPALGEPPGFAA